MDVERPLALTAGTRIDRFEVRDRLGGGGAGVVYTVADEEGRLFAMKTLRGVEDDGARNAARFAREARAANNVNHPSVVPVLSTGALPDGRPYLVMPLLKGETLQEVIASKGALAPARAWKLLRPIAEALALAHDQAVIHRDVKPSNIFVEAGENGSETSRLLDFGLAHAVDDPDNEAIAKLTQSGVLIGTPAYMAPEQWWGLPATPSVDQYGLGVTLFEALTGKTPFAGGAIRKLMEQALHEAAPAVSANGTPADAATDAFVKRLLAKDPADRFTSMKDVVEAGDAVFGPPIDSTQAARVTLGERGAARTWVWPWHVGVCVAGFAVLVSVGYAGTAPHDVVDWMRIGGFAQASTVLWLAVGFFYLPLSAKKQRAHLGNGAFFWALMPALSGLLGVYPNWRAVESGILRVRGLEAFRAFCEGTFESNAARFLGFAFGAILRASLSAVAAAEAAATADNDAHRSALERRANGASLFGLAALAAAAALLGAPSGAWIASIGALCVLGALLFPRRSARIEWIRVTAAFCAVLLAFAAAIARVEARQAALWSQPPTRAARVAEIMDARAEYSATWIIGAAAAFAAVAPMILRLTHAARGRPLPRPSRAAWALFVALTLAFGFDMLMRSRFLERREQLRSELAPQFATFVHLDPPSTDQLDPNVYTPHRSTGLQIGREAIAVNGRGVAKLAALETESGTFQVTTAIHQSLAQALVDRGADEVDLSVTADEKVPFKAVIRMLSIARAGGANQAELLFLIGPKPRLSSDNPPETTYVVPSDFAAVRVVLGDHGLTAEGDEAWGDAARRILAEASSDRPVPLLVSRGN
ncbi:MAG: serine/threonine protein kinase [Polyangiaceae bacterium]|nr:serine/threonine protein kinase [Polyangiaceae bacterium]